MDEKKDDYGWYIHSSTNRFELKGFSKIRTTKNKSEIAFNLIQAIVNKVTIPVKEKRLTVAGNKHVTTCDDLWALCSQEHREQLSKILPNYALEKYRGELQRLQLAPAINEDIKQIKNNIIDYKSASRIIFIHPEDMEKDEESRKGLLLYVKKHSNQCCIVNNTKELDAALNYHQEKNTKDMTLTIISDNNRTDNRFLDWRMQNAGKEIGVIAKQYECIGHVRLISCKVGEPDVDYMTKNSPTQLKQKTFDDISGRVLFTYQSEQNRLPYKSDSMAYQIWNTVMDNNPTREFSLSASPNYLHLDKQENSSHFVGSTHGAPFGVQHSFNENDKSKFTNFKTITLSTKNGMKARLSALKSQGKNEEEGTGEKREFHSRNSKLK